jgi:predicted ArsR family transcriptional regulator
MLRKSGVVAEYSLIDGGFALHEHNCPYSSAAKEHPEVCQVIHHVIDEALGGEHSQTESLAHGGKECRFELHPAET